MSHLSSGSSHPGNIIDRFAPLDGAAIHVQQLRCVKVRNRNVKCLRCVDACTSGCLSLIDGQLVVDERKCVGCGTCAPVCPTGALESRNPSDVELLNRCIDACDGGRLVLICELAYQALAKGIHSEKCARMVCAGRIDESLLCELASRGIDTVHIVCGLCENCEQKNGRETASLVADTANTLLWAWDMSMTILVSSELPGYVVRDDGDSAATQALLTRYFSTQRANKPVNNASGQESKGSSWSGRSPHGFAERMHVKRDGTLPHCIPDRREQLLCCLSARGKPRQSFISTRLWGMVEIDDSRCVSCQMCATFCPTGAIARFEDEDGTFGVDHYPGDCVKCRSCEDICMQRAITVLDEVPPEYLLEGAVCRHVMKPREVGLDSPHQMRDTMQRYINAPIKDFS
jgi:NAD-dependent dihydropyrimidine dehydrogenase PreA subunit